MWWVVHSMAAAHANRPTRPPPPWQDMDDPETMLNKCILNVCKAGNELLASGYCLYSSSTVLVLTVGERARARARMLPYQEKAKGNERERRPTPMWANMSTLRPHPAAGPLPADPLLPGCTALRCAAGNGVWGFTFDPLVGEFILSHPDIKIPEKGKIYSFNEGNYQVIT